MPQSLYREEGYDHRESLFGSHPDGGSLAETLYYADDKLCDPDVNTTKGYPARQGNKSWSAPFILMVDGGNCSLVTKVRNAQHAGAAGVIIANNKCFCSEAECRVASAESSSCETSEPNMADDGSGSDISIPSFLIFKTDADLIKKELVDGKLVQLEMSWALPGPNDPVKYDIWTVPTDVASKRIIQSFKPLAKALGERAHFTPHMYIYDGVQSGCVGKHGENLCYNVCTNNGRYCAGSDNDLDRGISGADVLKESLRRICIWKQYGEADGVGEVWWKYVEAFMASCDTPDAFTDEDCVLDAYRSAGVDDEMMLSCMANSGGLEEDAPNRLLEVAIADQAKSGVTGFPAAVVDSSRVRGRLTSSTIFHAICAGFAEGAHPEICKQCGDCPDALGCVLGGGVCTDAPDGG
eukprot:scaffold25072_cov152-Cylindrotheca_fusiformis.AAC.3